MGTKNVSLPQELEEYIDAKVASGEYSHASEVVRDAVRLMMRQEAEKLEWLRDAIAKGIEDIEAGRVIPSSQILASARKKGMELLRRRKK